MQEFRVNDFVTVIHEGWVFTGKQGQIKEIVNDGNEDGPIGVAFPEYYGYLLDPSDYKPGDIVRFEEIDLKLLTRNDPQDINHEQLVNLFFNSDMWHSFLGLDMPFMIGFTRCMHEDCDKLVVMRIMVNCHGTVSEADVCPKHATYHGRNCDGFPYKKGVARFTADTRKLVRIAKV